MYVTFTSIVLAFSILLGGTGATVYAAQDSLPNQLLYEVKILSEDVATSLSLGESQKLHLELDYASRRVEEMASLARMGANLPESVLLRLEKHLDQVIALAARTGEGDLTKALFQVRARLERQIRSLDDAPQTEPLMTRAREAIQTRLHWAELGLSEPNTFREQATIRSHFNQPPENEGGYGPGPGPNPDQETDQDGYGPGPYPDQDTDQGGYGPGPDPDQDAPQDGYGPGPIQESGPPDEGSGPNSDQARGSSSREGNGGKH